MDPESASLPSSIDPERASIPSSVVPKKEALPFRIVFGFQKFLLFVIRVEIRTLVIVFLAYIIFCFLWSIASPESIHPPEFHVNSATVNPLDFSNSTFTSPNTAVWNFTFYIKNPNTVSMYYKGFDVSLYYGKDFLSNVSIQPFQHEALETTKVSATMNASLTINNKVANTIENELIRNKAVNFDLKIQGAMSGQILYLFHDQGIKGSCQDLKMFLSDQNLGKMLGDPECQLGFW
ncbi:hypothetical protein Q3G72_001195 [Acer saccharum]|nr:hypothetical protein Q3G72_001195 [Acer saccharum]